MKNKHKKDDKFDYRFGLIQLFMHISGVDFTKAKEITLKTIKRHGFWAKLFTDEELEKMLQELHEGGVISMGTYANNTKYYILS